MGDPYRVSRKGTSVSISLLTGVHHCLRDPCYDLAATVVSSAPPLPFLVVKVMSFI